MDYGMALTTEPTHIIRHLLR